MKYLSFGTLGFPAISATKSVRWIRRGAQSSPLDRLSRLGLPRRYIYRSTSRQIVFHRVFFLPASLIRPCARQRAPSTPTPSSPLSCRKDLAGVLPVGGEVLPAAVAAVRHRVRVRIAPGFDFPSSQFVGPNLFWFLLIFARYVWSVQIIESCESCF